MNSTVFKKGRTEEAVRSFVVVERRMARWFKNGGKKGGGKEERRRKRSKAEERRKGVLTIAEEFSNKQTYIVRGLQRLVASRAQKRRTR